MDLGLNRLFPTDPTISFCEDHLRSIISQPANSWSNLSFIFAGIYLLAISRKTQSVFLKTLPITAILIGVFSFAFHASSAFWGGALDLISMLVFSSLLLTFSLFRLNIIRSTGIVYFYIVLVISSSVLYLFSVSQGFDLGNYIFGFQVFSVILGEFWLYHTAKIKYQLKYLFITLGIVAVALTAWLLDFFKVWCDPNTYHFFSGHVVWHILTGLSFILIYYFYKQFDIKEKDPQKSKI